MKTNDFNKILICLSLVLCHTVAKTQDDNLWHGYEILNSTLNGINFKIVFPEEANANRDWIWRARFWGHEPQCDLSLLDHGFHLAYIDVAGLWGNDTAVNRWDDFCIGHHPHSLKDPTPIVDFILESTGNLTVN